jgi:hypothetical protein
MQKLRHRWGIQSNFQLTLIIIVFALTGSSAAWLSRLFCSWIEITKEDLGHWFTPFRLLLILPIYQILLVCIGFLFGQFSFFWAFEKKMLRSMGLGFLLPRDESK